ncbi:HD-GYP domain-containing protein [Virgibacillus byunsanensis]|uniref:HD-GYP domain-containing protein n=1 Tax=Virgibacillus byunsanensis TaxID=570945 RepID=A0ABW3LNY5_9BACI
MRLVNTKSIKIETRLGQTIYNDNGQTLLQKGIKLSERMINRLINQGITYVYIEEQETSDIQVESTISEELRLEATNTIKEAFHDMKKNGFMEQSHILNKNGRKLSDIVHRIMEEIQGNENSLSLLSDIFVTDNYIFQHSLNVTIYSLAIGLELNLTERQLTEIGTGAMLHDIGKIFIDQEILQKPDKLTDEEFEVIQSHTELGFNFLRKHIDIPSVIAHCAYQHHERLDGTGYPRGIKGDDIHMYAKLIGVADVFDAVTSNRVYRDALLPHEGLEILYAGAVSLFEKDMVTAFKNSVAVYPEGLTVELSDKRVGVVTRQNKYLCDRPFIRIIEEKDQRIQSPYEVDLASVVNVTITNCIS